MKEPSAKYERIPGHHNDFLLVGEEHHSLWLGEDHLLYLIREGYTETYRRLYFRDIRMVVLHLTRRHVILSAIFGLIFGIFLSLLAVSYSNDWHVAAKVTFAVLAALSAIPLIVNLVRGPACVCRLATAVQEQRLYPLSRTRMALRTIASLHEKIDAAQGTLPWSELGAWFATAGAETGSTPSPDPAAGGRTDTFLKPCKGNAHRLLFTFLLFDFVFSLSDFLPWHDAIPDSVNLVLLALLLFASVAALVTQERSAMWPDIRRLAWIALVYLVSSLAIGILLAVIMPLRYGGSFLNGSSLYLHPTESIEGFVVCVLSVIVSGTVGGLGLKRTLEYQRSNRAQKVPPPLPAQPPRPPPAVHSPTVETDP